jgi:hypothetical protein
MDIQSHFRYLERNRWKRVMQRNTEKGATFEFEVSKENFDFMETWLKNHLK